MLLLGYCAWRAPHASLDRSTPQASEFPLSASLGVWSLEFGPSWWAIEGRRWGAGSEVGWPGKFWMYA
eukprot:3247276-Alexandrium_andersonii.AAC.1